MELKLKDWIYNYFGKTDIAVNFINAFFEQFKNMPKLLDPNLSREEFLNIVNFFYQIKDTKDETLEETYAFLKLELTEKRIRKDIFTTRNRIIKAIEFVRTWYLNKELEEVEKRLAKLREYEANFNNDLEMLKDLSHNLARKRGKKP